MSQINVGGVVKGGLAAGVVMNISEFVLNVPVAGEQMNAELAARNLPPVATNQIAVFVVLTFVLGLFTVWLYAAIRPRFGAGPKTAIIAGVFVWACTPQRVDHIWRARHQLDGARRAQHHLDAD